MTVRYRYPEDRWRGYSSFQIYNPDEGTYLGRTPRNLAKIGLFYLIFYGMLAALVAICMWVFSQTLNPRIPKWRNEESIIGTNPGLGFRPMPDNNEESTLIWLQGSNKTNYEKWKANLMSFLDTYYTPGKIEKGNVPIKRCSYDELPIPGQVCDIDVRKWEPCSPDRHFDYHRNAPCIFLKLNRIYGWVPEYYNDPNDLPEDMPQQLKDHIRYNITRPEERNNIWISCIGENPADNEYLGPVKYYPSIQGFPGYYYPYMNSEGYLSPLVAVQFKRPTSGLVINIECRAWAKNIKYHRHDRSGSVHFELLID
ncbi:sodium/potassium-transporting ATPase subunit beta-2-like isoform X2 [Coccinella septempunctata]|uniref:sodium/potassium-transporting ATPase subunit beta-2-like isoform X2 n=1 Tax=Coccinella septempunctata TaxID=41139 RepID=UPI001D087EF1|nr:sodium/potassium-transporting ATPase subunit beta-2-like isoform X2 [Coccinella septempunctata]